MERGIRGTLSRDSPGLDATDMRDTTYNVQIDTCRTGSVRSSVPDGIQQRYATGLVRERVRVRAIIVLV